MNTYPTKQHLLDLAAAYALSTTAQNKAIAAAFRAEAERLYPTAPPARGIKPIPFSPSSPFNTLIPATATWSEVPILNRVGTVADGDTNTAEAGNLRKWYGGEAQVNITHGVATDPVWTITLPEFGNTDQRFNRHWPAGVWRLHCPSAGPIVGTNQDAVVHIVDETTGEYIEILDRTKYTIDVASKTIVGVSGVAHAHGNVDTGLGVGGLLASGGNSAGVRASNFSWAAGAITGYDVSQVLSGKKTDFGHALCVMLGVATLSTWGVVAPATAPNNAYNHGPIPNGARIGIPAGVAKPSTMSTDLLNVALWNTMQRYGAFVGDFVDGVFPIMQFDGGSTDPSVMAKMWAWWDNPNCANVHMSAALRVMN